MNKIKTTGYISNADKQAKITSLTVQAKRLIVLFIFQIYLDKEQAYYQSFGDEFNTIIVAGTKI